MSSWSRSGRACRGAAHAAVPIHGGRANAATDSRRRPSTAVRTRHIFAAAAAHSVSAPAGVTMGMAPRSPTPLQLDRQRRLQLLRRGERPCRSRRTLLSLRPTRQGPSGAWETQEVVNRFEHRTAFNRYQRQMLMIRNAVAGERTERSSGPELEPWLDLTVLWDPTQALTGNSAV